MPRDLGNPGETPDRPGNPREDLERMRGFLTERAAETPGFVKNNVALDRYDARLFRELLESSEELRTLAEAREAPATFGPLLLDLFASFYKFVPDLLDAGEVDPAHLRSNRPFIERLREDEETAIVRLTTSMDEVASGLATVQAGKKILQELRRRPDLQRWAERQASSEPPAPKVPSVDSGSTTGCPADIMAQDAPPSAAPGGASEEAQDADPAPAADLRAAMRAAMRAASEEANEHAAALRGWGLTPKDLRVVPLGERLEFARKLRTRRMRYLADLLGRMRNQRRATERRKVRANRDEVHCIETSSDLARALPSEIAGAFGTTNPNRRRAFYRRLSERNVLSYSLRTDEPVGRGPIVAMIDSSGSMSGEPMQWASAVALALAHAATGRAGTGARRVHAIYFNAKIVLETELAPGERDVRKFLNIGTVDAAGGTEYVPPISRALEILSAGSKPDAGAADLLLVTDGVCRLPEDFSNRLREEKSARGFRLVSVLVGDHADAATLETFSDKILRADDLARVSGARDAAGELFESL